MVAYEEGQAGAGLCSTDPTSQVLLMIYILHYLQDPKLGELWTIPYYGYCRIYIINRIKSRSIVPVLVGMNSNAPNVAATLAAPTLQKRQGT